MLYKYFY